MLPSQQMLGWLKFSMRTALPSGSVGFHKTPQMGFTPRVLPVHSSALPLLTWKQSHRQFVPCETMLAQITSVIFFISQASNIAVKKRVVVFYSPRNKKKKKKQKTTILNICCLWSWVGRNLSTPFSFLDVTELARFSFFPFTPEVGFVGFSLSWNILYEVLTVLTASCVIQSFPAQARKK